MASFLVAMARKVPQAGTSGEASPDREASGTRSNLSGSEFLFDLCSVVSVLLYQPDGISPFEMVLLHEVPDFIVFATVNRCPVLRTTRRLVVCHDNLRGAIASPKATIRRQLDAARASLNTLGRLVAGTKTPTPRKATPSPKLEPRSERLLQARGLASLRIVRIQNYHSGGGICFAEPSHGSASHICQCPCEDMIDRP